MLNDYFFEFRAYEPSELQAHSVARERERVCATGYSVPLRRLGVLRESNNWTPYN